MPDTLAFVSWYLVVLAMGLIAWPLGFHFLRWLPGRAWAYSKALGLLLIGYTFWLLGSLGFLMNTLGGILFAIAVVLAASAWAARRAGFAELRDFLKRNWQFALATEVLFLGAFALWAFVRAHNPEIQATEKPMEFAFLNAINRSQIFPPLDPWLSGYAISYYYFGYVIVGLLTKLTGVLQGVAFNLGLSLIFALVAVGAWGVVYDLIAAEKSREGTDGTGRTEGNERSTPATRRESRASSSLHPSHLHLRSRAAQVQVSFILLPSLLGPLFVLIMGNLGGFLEVLHSRHVLWGTDEQGQPVSSFWKWVDLENLEDPPPGEPSWLSERYLWWWRSSRVIRDRDLSLPTEPTGWQFSPTLKFLGHEGQPIDLQPIDEFPMFSFLLGDLHPHVLALPFVLLAVAFAFNLMLRPPPATLPASQPAESPDSRLMATLATPFRSLGLLDFVVYAVVLGALSFLNTWDFPIYLLVTMAAYGVARAWGAGWSWGVALEAAALGGGLLVAGVLLYLPFYLGFQTQAGGLLPNIVFPTRLPQFFIMFGPPLTIVLIFLVWLAARSPVGRQANWSLLPVTALTILGQTFLLALALGLWVLYVRPELIAYVNDFLSPVSISAALELAAVRRLTNPWTALLLLFMLGTIFALLAPRRPSLTTNPAPLTPAPNPLTPSISFALILAGVAALLTFAPEFVYLKDNFGARMNTIFKFYYQAWLQWGVVAAFACWYLGARLRGAGRAGFQAVAVLAAGAGLLYPLQGVWKKAEGFQLPATLDGFAYMRTLNRGDFDAILWLNENVSGAATIAEAIGGQYSEFGRVSASTGLPTVLGWPGHEGQWRGNQFGQQVGSREPDIALLYKSRSWRDAEEILNRYDIRYVYFGALEANKYGLGGAAKFEEFMTPIYQADGVTIYERVVVAP